MYNSPSALVTRKVTFPRPFYADLLMIPSSHSSMLFVIRRRERVYRLRSKYALEAKKATLESMTVSPTQR